MTDIETVVEWDRTARNVHETFTVALPRQLAKKWRLESGSTLTLSLQSDGTLMVKPSKSELDFQKRIRGVE